MRTLLYVALLCSLSACAAWEGFDAAPVEQAESQKLTEAQRWWRVYNDPLMDTLADQLLVQNIDLKIAASRIEESRALSKTSRAGFFPDISLTGTATRENKDTVKYATILQGGFDASWELDIFGRIRATVDAADARVLSVQATSQDVRNSVLADLMRAVIDWRQANEILMQTKALLKAQDDQVSIYRTRAKAGLIDATFVERAQAQREQTATQVPLAQASANTAQYQIERLLGKNPGDLTTLLKESVRSAFTVPQPNTLKDIPLDAIQSRPDVAAARADLLAAQADTREAEANLWPRITLSSFFGLQDIKSGSPFLSNSQFIPSNPIWSLGSQIALPLLNFGRLRGQVEAADARTKQAELRYENTVLAALQEAHTALSDYVNGVNALTQQRVALKHRQETIVLARTRFERGLTDMTDLTTAQAELDQATLLLIERKAFAATAYIRLQKALGAAVQEPTKKRNQISD